MHEYLWPGLVTLGLTLWAVVRYRQWKRAVQRGQAALGDVNTAFENRRLAALALAATVRAFRPRQPEAITALEAATQAARAADLEPTPQRLAAEQQFTVAVNRLPPLVEADALLRIHAGSRKSLEALVVAHQALANCLTLYNQQVEATRALGQRFPEKLVGHLLEISELTTFDSQMVLGGSFAASLTPSQTPSQTPSEGASTNRPPDSSRDDGPGNTGGPVAA